jgi:prepilin-type N-terminal cleavage/methylation domain-containing protein
MTCSIHRLRSGRSRPAGFSLVEVLIVVVILGVIVFLAIPNIVQVRQDSEDNLARSRAEALNVAAAAYFQSQGVQAASANWVGAGSDEARYTLIKPYLAFAPDTLASYMPAGYTASFSGSDPLRAKATILRGGTAIPY